MIVKVEKVVYGGKGLSRDGSKVIFTPFVLPDETVKVKPVKEKKGFIETELTQVIEESKFRREPLCKYFTVCGGCDYQHIQYDFQLKIKEENLKENLIRIGKITEFPSIEIVPSPKEFFYRNRVQFKVCGNHLGFYKKSTHQVIDIDNCPLLLDEIFSIPSKLKEVLTFFVVQPYEIHVFYAGEGALLKFFFPKRIKSVPKLKDIKKILNLKIQGLGIYYKKGNRTFLQQVIGNKFTFEKVLDYRFRIGIDSFFQVNKYQLPNLIKIVSENVKGAKILADMYCGVGTFSIPSSKFVEKVYGFELNRFAIDDAKENAQINQTNNVEFFPFETKKGIDFLIQKKIPVDTIIFDPPRSGLNRYIIEKTSSIKSLHKIVYVSCNPSTLARELNLFKTKGFSIQKIYMIDMFPQTYHIESIVVLTRNS